MGDHCLELTAITVGLRRAIRRGTGRILPPRLPRPKHYSASATAASAQAILSVPWGRGLHPGRGQMACSLGSREEGAESWCSALIGEKVAIDEPDEPLPSQIRAFWPRRSCPVNQPAASATRVAENGPTADQRMAILAGGRSRRQRLTRALLGTKSVGNVPRLGGTKPPGGNEGTKMASKNNTRNWRWHPRRD